MWYFFNLTRVQSFTECAWRPSRSWNFIISEAASTSQTYAVTRQNRIEEKAWIGPPRRSPIGCAAASLYCDRNDLHIPHDRAALPTSAGDPTPGRTALTDLLQESKSEERSALRGLESPALVKWVLFFSIVYTNFHSASQLISLFALQKMTFALKSINCTWFTWLLAGLSWFQKGACVRLVHICVAGTMVWNYFLALI